MLLGQVAGQDAGDVELEHPVEAPERQPRAQAHRQLHDLPLAVTGLETLEEGVVERVVVGRVQLRVLRRETGLSVTARTEARPMFPLPHTATGTGGPPGAE